MDRIRDGRRSSMAATNGLSRRRHRSTYVSEEDGGQVELQETARLRDRSSKRERDRDFVNRNNNKRTRGESGRLAVVVQGNSREFEGGETTEESVGDEDDYELEDAGVLSRNSLPPNAAVSSSSSLLPNSNHRKILPRPGPRLARQAPALKVSEETIGPVPRKARSASVKRSHESWASGNGGFGEDQNLRLAASTSSMSRSGDAASPSSSNISVRKKTVKPAGPKTRLPKASKSSIAAQEDIEIEIAEVLYGLMKQSQSSKKDSAENTSPKPDSNDTNGVLQDSRSSPILNSSRTPTLTQSANPAFDPFFPSVALKNQKMKVDPLQDPNSSIVSFAVKDKSEKPVEMDVLSAEMSKTSAQLNTNASEVLDICASKASSDSPALHNEVEMEDLKPEIEDSGAERKEELVSERGESAMCSKLDSTGTKTNSTVSEADSQRDKFMIDLMAPPPMSSTPEQDGFVNSSLDPNSIACDIETKTEIVAMSEEKVESLVKKESVVAVEFEKENVKAIGEKSQIRFDLEKPSHQSGKDGEIKLQHKQQSKVAISKVEMTAQSSTVPLSIAVAGWPNGLPPLGYMPPFQTVVPMDGTTGSATEVQHKHFLPSQANPKRCAIHHYIACNIRLHQQFTKVNHFWPAAANSAALCGSKPNNLNVMPSDNMIVGNPLKGSFPVVTLNTTQDRGQTHAKLPAFNGKDRSSEEANLMDPVQKKQLALQQHPQPAAPSNLLHGPAFIFSLSQHQATVAATTGSSKSSTSVNNASFTSNALAGVAANPSALPAVAAAMSFNYPNLTANETPYMTILPNNGCAFPIAPVGNPPGFRGGNPSQALPLYSGSFYPSQMLHPSLQQQHPQSRPVLQPVLQNASTSSGSSSSQKQQQVQQTKGAQVGGNNFLISPNVQSQQPQSKRVQSHQSQKPETEMSGESISRIADNRSSHMTKSVHGQSFMVPYHTNFALIPSTAANVNCSHSEKQQQHQSKEKISKAGMDIVSSQAFAMSFSSFNGNTTPVNLNFSSMAQTTPIFQGLPDITRQVISVPQVMQKKNHQASEGRNGSSSTSIDDGKKGRVGKPTTSTGQTLVFDNSSRNLNFVSSPFTGNWPSRSITQSANVPVATSSPISHQQQQQQLFQVPKQHVSHHQQQQPAGFSRSKEPTSSSLSSSCAGEKISNNSPMFSQSPIQSNGSGSPQIHQWNNTARASVCQGQGPLPSMAAGNNNSNYKSAGQQHGRASQGQSQISFGGSPKSLLAASQGQQIPCSNQCSTLIINGSPHSSGNLKGSSGSNKASSPVPPAMQTQQSDNSSTRNAQKSSPVCGRNVPSILSTCPNHLSELKY